MDSPTLGGPALARAMHGVIEPIHAILYFGDEVMAAWTALGLEPRAQGYVAGRTAPMGPIGPDAAAAVFYNFNPALFHYTLPAVWDIAEPAKVLTARGEAMQALYERVGAPTDGLDEATTIAGRMVQATSTAGRPLAAANAGVPLPGTPFADLWQLLAVLREHRGDGHVGLLMTTGIDPVEALVLYSSWQGSISRRFLQTSRLWDDEAWEAGIERLRTRGWADEEGLTPQGTAAREALEDRTDQLAAAPYETVGKDVTLKLFDLLLPFVHALNDASAYPRAWTVPVRPV